MNIEFSESELHGLDAISIVDKNILSAGISTGGKTEIEMMRRFPDAHVTATTIDKEGVEHSKQMVLREGLTEKIEVKYEDVSAALPYEDSSVDYIYARLVLHYLPNQRLDASLQEFSRILKPGGKVYIVVRSTECPDAKMPGNEYDEATGITTYHPVDPSGQRRSSVRRFHTVDSINGFVGKYFKIEYTKQYDERLYRDYARTQQSPHTDNVIELLAIKEA